MSERFQLSISKSGDIPVYRQIVENITQRVKSGDLNAGDKLPPERELAKQAAVSRGTITRAYEILHNNHIVEIIQGRGTFISKNQNVLVEGRKEQALKRIESMIVQLERLNFSHKEIDILVHLALMEREKAFQDFHLAAVDCNPESLAIFENQLMHVTKGQMTKFLLDEFDTRDDFKKKLSPFDLVITTSTHYSELMGACPGMKNKIIQAAVSPSQQTIIDLAGISETARIGVLCQTRRFVDIVKSKLRELRINMKLVESAFESDTSERLDDFINSRDILIIRPNTEAALAENHKKALENFTKTGGKIIEYHYQIERGTLIQIDEKINDILNRKSHMDGGAF